MISTPCPYCGAPLPSARAKQCLKCHRAWHNATNVIQVQVDPTWNRFGLDPHETYVVELCQDPSSGRRYTKYKVVPGGIPDQFAVLETSPASGSAFIEWGFYKYSKHLKLSDGQAFGFDAHGVWLTSVEIDYMVHEPAPESTEAPWVNGIPPRLPPK